MAMPTAAELREKLAKGVSRVTVAQDAVTVETDLGVVERQLASATVAELPAGTPRVRRVVVSTTDGL